jgi:SAM-dependent methyltransferase
MLDLAGGYVPYYAERAGEKERARQVGWRDQHAQHSRFEQFVRAIGHPADAPFEVADVGCGLGDLLPFLRGKGFTGLRYHGYDILPDMVEAATACHEDPAASFRRIDEMGEIERADYCFASGIFNAKLDNDDEAWWGHVQACVREMAAKSASAVAFNMLSTYSDKEKQEATLYYADPCRVFDWCKREISRDVALLHDYGQWDFTIILRMNQGGQPKAGAS